MDSEEEVTVSGDYHDVLLGAYIIARHYNPEVEVNEVVDILQELMIIEEEEDEG